MFALEYFMSCHIRLPLPVSPSQLIPRYRWHLSSTSICGEKERRKGVGDACYCLLQLQAGFNHQSSVSKTSRQRGGAKEI